MAATNIPPWLAAEIEKTDGFISVHNYMAACLYHPQHGYYTNGLNFKSECGTDFVTAPLLSPIFGATISNWVAQSWHDIGEPKHFILAEAGPGDGTLMLHILNSLPKPVALACEVLMVETSPALTTLQQQKLAAFKNISWATTLTPQAPPTLLVANELLDAFPVQVFEFKNAEWVEHGFDEQLNPATRPTSPPESLTSDTPNVISEGDIVEVSHSATSWLQNAAKIATRGLFIDYGATPESHLRATSVQAMQGHQGVPLTHQPGRSDLTAHVNFAQAAGSLGGLTKLADLSEFLLQFKILAAAELTIHTPGTAAALHRLLHPTRMGALFKVLEYRQN